MTNKLIQELSYQLPLNSGATYSTAPVVVLDYNTLCVTFASDQDLTFTIYYSNDGINWDFNKVYANISSKTIVPVYSKFVYLDLENISASNMTYLRFTTYGVSEPIITETFIAGNTQGTSLNCNVSNLPTNAFGSLKCDTPYTKSPYKYSTSFENSGAETFNSGNIKTGYEQIQFQSDVPANAYGCVLSDKVLHLRYPDRTGALTYSRILGENVLYQSSTPLEFRFTMIFYDPFNDTTKRDQYLVGAGNVNVPATITNRNFLGFGWSGSDGVTTSEFGIYRIREGVEYFIPQSSWNQTTLSTNDDPFILDHTKLNIVSIDLAYLGASNIDFKIFNPKTGSWVLVHRIEYPNNNAETHVSDPSFHFMMYHKPTLPASFPSAGDPLCGSASFGAIIYSNYARTAYNSYENTIALGASTETPVIIIHNPSSWLGKPNSVLCSPLIVNCACDGTKNCIFRIYRTTTAGVSGVSWVNIDADYSPVQYSTAGTLVSGKKAFSFVSAKTDSTIVDMSTFSLFANGDTVWIITAFSTASSDISASISWSEVK